MKDGGHSNTLSCSMPKAKGLPLQGSSHYQRTRYSRKQAATMGPSIASTLQRSRREQKGLLPEAAANIRLGHPDLAGGDEMPLFGLNSRLIPCGRRPSLPFFALGGSS